MKRRIITVLAFAVALFVLFTGTFTTAAEVPYTSYTYWSTLDNQRTEVYNRPMLSTETVLNAKKIGIKEFTSLNDICTDKSGNIYILDGASRIVVLNDKYELLYEIGNISGTEKYDDARSVYVAEDNSLYICDTEGGRVLHTDLNGKLLEIIGSPESQLIPDDFKFRPTYVAVDAKGCMYILSDGSYYGALLFDENKNFLGFYGANTVTSGISGVLTNIKNRVFPNNTKKGNTARRIPYCFVDIKTDSEGFVYTCNGSTEKWGSTGQIRKLSPGTGKNILDSDGINFVDAEINTEYSNGAFSKQDIMNIEINGDGFIFALESTFGKVFLYDSECRMLTAFGGGMHEGTQNGTFVNVSGMALLDDGDRVLVSDKTNNNITVFYLNDYGKKVLKADILTISGEYEEAESNWKEILKLDNCNQAAYSGLAYAAMYGGDSKTAMEYAKTGYDNQAYALAFESYRNDYINSHFVLIFTLTAVLIIGIIVVLAVSMRKKTVIIKNQKLKLLLGTMVHPVNTFAEVKEKQQGSLLISASMLLLFYLSVILNTLESGFLFSKYDPENFNSIWILARTVGLVVLWIVADWMVCTIMSGKGKLREIAVVTCYSLLPIVIKNFLSLILTNVLLPSEAGFLTILDAVAIIYFVLLMILGLIKIHDFGFGRMLLTSILSILGVAIIFFLIIMIVMLFQQTYGFIATVISELLTL